MTLFALSPYRGRQYQPFLSLPGALTPEEVAEWLRALEELDSEVATVSQTDGSVVDPSFRGARLGWLYPGAETARLFEKLGEIAERANAESFGFDLLGFAEPVQYTVYEAPSVGYEWHFDMIDAPTDVQRKLSLTVQLSPGGDYDGGDLEVRDGFDVVTAPRDLGCVVAFPGWAIHRVTPVTRGIRRSLVAWIGGPRFR